MLLIPHKLAKGWGMQARNIRALIVRDLMMRYGRGNLGFAWAILEPMILCSGVMVVWSVTVGSVKHGINLVEFILTGYMPLTLWRHMTNHSVMIFRRSAELLYHRRISLFDIVGAKLCLEFIGATAALLVVWGGLNIFGIVGDIARLDLFILGWLMMGWLAAAFSLILAAITEYWETAERFVQPFQYLSIPISGTFALVDWLPKWAQDAVLFNPMVHCYEVFRGGFFGPSITVHYSLTYFSACAFVLTYIGVAAVRRIRSRVQIA